MCNKQNLNLCKYSQSCYQMDLLTGKLLTVQYSVQCTFMLKFCLEKKLFKNLK